MGISTAAELDARLLSIRDMSPGEGAFVAEARALARDLQVGIGCDSLLKIALAGLAPRVSNDPPGTRTTARFSGRSIVLAPAPTRLDDMTEGWEPDEVQGLLLESCIAAVGSSGNQAELIQIYVACLARPDFRREIGVNRPVDLHVLSALTAERASVSALPPVTFDLDVEVALYRWLWGLLGAPGPAEFVEEVVARRTVRLALANEPLAMVAVKLSEVSVVHLLPFEGPADSLADPPLTMVEILGAARELSLRSQTWSWRLRGLQSTDDVEHQDAGERPYVMSGRALRWLLERGVPIGGMRLGRIDDYAKSVIEMLDRGEGTEPLGAHMNVVLGLAEDGTHLSLAEELAALAWLCGIYDVYVDLEAFLDVRDRALRGAFD